MRAVVVVLLLLVCCCVGVRAHYAERRAADKLRALPGQPSVAFNQWSGYVDLDGDVGRHLFYYFSESTKLPHTKPLVLWLNGGMLSNSDSTPILVFFFPNSALYSTYEYQSTSCRYECGC